MAYTQAQLDAMAVPCQAMRDALKARQAPDLGSGIPNPTVATIRQTRADHLAKLRHLYPIPSRPAEVSESDHTVKARDGYEIPIKITVPVGKTVDKGSPLIVLFHEGGWCLGDFTDEEHDAWSFSLEFGAVCVNVEYRLAPEHKYPVGVQDCYDVVKWVAATASPDNPLVPANPRNGFIVAGSSAGGNLAAVMSQIARDEHLQPPITGQYLAVPATLDAFVPDKWKDQYRSRWTSVQDPVLDLSNFMEHPMLLALQGDPTDPRFAPLLHENLKGLPPAYFQISGIDPLRDEGLIYARELQENGNKVKMDVYEGYGHMFWTNWPELERSKEFFSDASKGVKWLLEQGREQA